jgi:menaquinone-specific isochorismate synthase
MNSSESVGAGYGRLLSITLPCPNIDPLAFVQQVAGSPRLYWQDADTTIVGGGAALELTAWGAERFEHIAQEAAERLADAQVVTPQAALAPRLFGGFSFRDDFVPDYRWSAFAPAHFILPHYQLTRQGDESFLTLNSLVGSDEPTAALIPELRRALIARIDTLTRDSRALPPVVSTLHYPVSPARWRTMVEAATARISAGELKKVVLARLAELTFAEAPDLGYPLQYLREHYPNCTIFLFEPRAGHAFVGATPERLINLSGRQFDTMALAASIARGESEAEDAELAQTLLADPKERLEHQLVIDALSARLTPIAAKLSTAPTTVMKLSNIQHLYTQISGTLNQPLGVLELLKLLHPTPALGGAPKEVALALIRDAEVLPRGWFAAPIGYLTPQLDGRFAVAIRSAVVQQTRAWLFAGAGIVAASEADKEWRETSLKFVPMLRALAAAEVTPASPLEAVR